MRSLVLHLFGYLISQNVICLYLYQALKMFFEHLTYKKNEVPLVYCRLKKNIHIHNSGSKLRVEQQTFIIIVSILCLQEILQNTQNTKRIKYPLVYCRFKKNIHIHNSGSKPRVEHQNLKHISYKHVL